jgi:hypothetical protein
MGAKLGLLILREEHRVRVFENRLLRRTFGPRRDEVTGDWRKLHNKELHNLYLSVKAVNIYKLNMQPFRKLPAILRNQKVHHRVLKSPPLAPILSQFQSSPYHPNLSL